MIVLSVFVVLNAQFRVYVLLQYWKMIFSALAELSCLLLFLASSHADTPANCTYKEILGRWIFFVGEGNKDRTIDCSSYGKTFLCYYLTRLADIF